MVIDETPTFCTNCHSVSPAHAFPYRDFRCLQCVSPTPAEQTALEKGYDLTLCRECNVCKSIKPLRQFQHYVPERKTSDNLSRQGRGYAPSSWQEGKACAICAGRTVSARLGRVKHMSVTQLERGFATGALDPVKVGDRELVLTAARVKEKKTRRAAAHKLMQAVWGEPWRLAIEALDTEMARLRSKVHHLGSRASDTHLQPMMAFITQYMDSIRELKGTLRDHTSATPGEIKAGRHQLRLYEARIERQNSPVQDASKPRRGRPVSLRDPDMGKIMTQHSVWAEHVVPSHLILLSKMWGEIEPEIRDQQYKTHPMLLNRFDPLCFSATNPSPGLQRWLAEREKLSHTRYLHALETEKLRTKYQDAGQRAGSIARGRALLGPTPQVPPEAPDATATEIRTPEHLRIRAAPPVPAAKKVIDWDAAFPGTE